MDITTVLTDILIVLVAAKVAAEVAERIGVPAVVGEIVAGILVGPSLIGLVGEHDEVLRPLGEIGVILLLLEVGMEMDIGELAKVGRASLLVAVVGVWCFNFFTSRIEKVTEELASSEADFIAWAMKLVQARHDAAAAK